MVSLTQLDASANQLASLPAGFGVLAALTAADLSNNALGALPAGLSGLKRLKDLDLRANAPLVVHGSVLASLRTRSARTPPLAAPTPRSRAHCKAWASGYPLHVSIAWALGCPFRVLGRTYCTRTLPTRGARPRPTRCLRSCC